MAQANDKIGLSFSTWMRPVLYQGTAQANDGIIIPKLGETSSVSVYSKG
jgi:hypothetical protein